jgi:hypothetical protein
VSSERDLSKLIRDAAESALPKAESVDPVPDLSLDLEEHRLSFEIDCLQQELNELKDNHQLRLTYTARIFWLVVAWLACVVASIIMSGLAAWGFHLSDGVLIAFITSTTVNVVGLFVLVAKWMFPSGKGSSSGATLQVKSSTVRARK